MSILYTHLEGLKPSRQILQKRERPPFWANPWALGLSLRYSHCSLRHVSCGLDFLWAGKSHLCRAVTHHEESVREASLCKKLRNIEVLQEVLSAAHQRSRLKYTQLRDDYDLLSLIDVPDIICEWPGCRCQVQSVPCERQGRSGVPPAGAGQTLAVCRALGQGRVLLLPWSPHLLLPRSRAFFMVFVLVDPLVAADPLLPLNTPPMASGPCHLGSLCPHFPLHPVC